METLEDLLHLPLTEIEINQKKHMELHPKLKDKILTADELSDLITRLIQENQDSQPYARNLYLQNNPLRAQQERYIASLLNAAGQAEGTVAFNFACHQAISNIPEAFDIAVSRMFRYMPAHWHTNEYIEIYYVFSGLCPLLLEGETIEMQPGTVMILSPFANHATPCYQDDCILFCYLIRSDVFNSVFWNNISSQNLMSEFFYQALNSNTGNQYLRFETGDDPEIRKLLYRSYQEYAGDKNYRFKMLNALMNEFFILLLRDYEDQVMLPTNGSFYWKSGFGEIFTYIQSHSNTVTLKELSQKFSYSERQLIRLIQSCTGRSFTDLIYELRMRNAATLLETTLLSTEQVAQIVGYNNLSSFHRAFVRHYDCSPAKFRKKNATLT